MAKIIKIKTAFSIAEVLVTMLVVSLIMVMVAPIFTKKNAVRSSVPPGEWTCTLDASGRHVASDGSVAADGSYCIFKPIPGVTDYSVYAIGGGGGGAAGSDSGFNLVSFGQSATAEIPESGSYNYVMVGGGGGGASYNRIFPGDPRGRVACNGAHGIFKSGTLELTKGTQISIQGGYGGVGGERRGDGFSAIGVVSCDSEVSREQDGGESLITTRTNDGEQNISADGGSAGDKSKYSGCATAELSASDINSLISFTGFSSNFISNLGRGGSGSTCEVAAKPGTNGLVMVKSSLVSGGGGGSAGSVAYRTVEKPPSEVIVKVGQGGAGGTYAANDGYQGQPSAFGNYLIAAGGAGGHINATQDPTHASGTNGEASPLGGIYSGSSGANNAQNDMDQNQGYVLVGSNMYGAGGGGGGYDSSNGFGKGGRGASGIVRVEWH